MSKQDLQKAQQLLTQEGHTLVLCRQQTVHTSSRRGVSALLGFLEDGTDLRGFSAADKVVGRATAFLYRLLGVTQVYGAVMSQPALEVLQEGGIAAYPGKLVSGIINRQGDGPCPMEQATTGIQDPQQALEAIRQALAKLKK